MSEVPLWLDLETYCPTELKGTTTDVYVADPGFRITVAAWFVEGVMHSWDESVDEGPPGELVRLLSDERYRLHSWNCRFERLCIRAAWGIDVPRERWHDDMIHAMSLALPASLAQCGAALGFPPEDMKNPEGTRLITKFAKPRTPTKNKPWTRNTYETDPEDWQKFVDYCRQDVVAEMKIYRRLRKWPMPEHEWAMWRLDQRINDRGIPIDMALVERAYEQVGRNKDYHFEAMKAATHLHNPNSVAQLRSWLDQRGIQTENLDKQTVSALLKRDDLEPGVREVLEHRQALGVTSVTKYAALRRAVSSDGRLRGTLQFMGASRTGRWAGRIYQPHNLPRGSRKPHELHDLVAGIREGGDVSMHDLQDALRAAIRAPEGQVLLVADLANIESRITGWISDDPTMLKVFAEGRDIYKDYGQALLGKPETEITKAERNYCKPPSLAAAFGLGARGLVAYADAMGVAMDQEAAQVAVDAFRSRYSEVPRLWKKLEGATMRLVREAKPAAIRVGRLTFEYDRPWLFMGLPSGRRVAYLQPRIEMKEAPWGDDVETLTYMGMNQYTRKWERLSCFGGRWVEQACQSIARDVLAEGIKRADDAGLEVVASVHDEIIALADEDDWRCVEVLVSCMAARPEWADEDLYLDAEGFTDVIYRKD